MAYKMKGSSLYGKLKLNRNMDDSSNPDGRAKSSAFQRVGSFVDGERVTFDAALEAEKEGKAVVHTNKEATRRTKRDLKSKDEQTRKGAEQAIRNWKEAPYEGEKGKKGAHAKAKAADRKAQDLLERRTNILKTSERATGDRDAEGRKGQPGKRSSEKAFEEKHKDLKTVDVKDASGKKSKSAAGASRTVVYGDAHKKQSSTDTSMQSIKSKKDYDAEKEAARRKVIRDRTMNPKKKPGAPMKGGPNKTFKQGFKSNKPKTKMLKGTTVFGKTIGEIKEKGKKVISKHPLTKVIKKGIRAGKTASDFISKNKDKMGTGNPNVKHETAHAKMYQKSKRK